MKLISVRTVVLASIGMGLALSMSSLLLWEGTWATAGASAYDTHGTCVLVGCLTCIVVFLWSLVHPRSLGTFLEKICFPIMIASLLYSLTPGVVDINPLGFIARFLIPTASVYLITIAWIAAIAEQDTETGLLALLIAWMISAALRAAFGVLGEGVDKTVILAVFALATWILLLLCTKGIDRSQPMIVNAPRENATSYTHALGSIWKCALYSATFAFLSGIIRSLSLQMGAMGIINYASILGALLSALALALIWRWRTVRFSINYLFRAVFPFMVIVLCALPYFGAVSLSLVACVIYILYSFMCICMQVLCVQTSQNYGVNPAFCASFVTGLSLILQGLGYLLGNAVNIPALSTIPPLDSIALISVAVLALVMFVTRGLSLAPEEGDANVELISLSRKPVTTPSADNGELDAERIGSEHGSLDGDATAAESATAGTRISCVGASNAGAAADGDAGANANSGTASGASSSAVGATGTGATPGAVAGTNVAVTGAATAGTPAGAANAAAGPAASVSAPAAASIPAASGASSGLEPASERHYADRIAMRCEIIAKKYYLSSRELEVMTLYARGYTMAGIAHELYISDNTVKTHLRRIYQKLGISKKQQLTSLVNSHVDLADTESRAPRDKR